jgi:hypothetical protein
VISLEIPIACALTDKQLQERRKTVLQKISERLIEVRELKDGFSYRFPAEDSILLDLINIINLERKCCPFLNFKLIIEAQNNFVLLELTGREGTKEMLQTLFDWN